MRRILSTSMFCLAAAAGCNNATQVGTDGGTPAGADMAVVTKPADMAMAPADMATPLVGNKVATGNFELLGPTTDDYVIGVEAKMGIVAQPFDGKALKVISADAQDLRITGKAVFYWFGVDQTTQMGTGVVWMNGTQYQFSDASRFAVYGASADGAYIFWSEKGDPQDGAFVDLVVSKADGSGKAKIGTAAINDNCFPQGRFAAGSTVVVNYCDNVANQADGGVADAHKLVAVDAATGKITQLGAANMANWFEINRDGTKVASADANKQGWLLPIAGGNGAMIDADVADAEFTPDNSTIVFRTSAGALKSAPTAGGAAKQIVAKDATFLQSWVIGMKTRDFFPAFTPDGKYVMYSTNIDAMTGLGDISMVAVGGGTPVQLVNDLGALFGDAFTSDSAKAVYYTNCASGVGKMTTMPVTGGMGTVVPNTKPVWVGYSVAGGNKFVYNDNWKAVTNTNGRADIKVVDINTGADAKLIAAQAEADFIPNFAKKKIAYAMRVTGVPAGLYIADVP